MRALAVLALLMCRDDRYEPLEQRTYDLERKLRDMPEPPVGKWWCAPASCDRDRAKCDAAEAALVRDSQRWASPLPLVACRLQVTAFGDGSGRWLATLKECQAIASDGGRCIGVQ